ncbi:hypothetical protein SAMN04488005_0453 [Yoonia tamlensis]|uniref:Uncharacterized protein n=1 Tax=Yoonia tamlensis TaxID=390270 RepID=A0A1I6FTS9_9RHOB|nr:hypothetical protein SAMN04488005_0453 [Yoonia tamlensis]
MMTDNLSGLSERVSASVVFTFRFPFSVCLIIPHHHQLTHTVG